MGSVGNFLFGGSQQQQGSQNQSSQSSSSQNQSSNSSNQLSASDSVSNQASGSNQYNQAYAPIAASMNPVLSSTAAAGNMMAALLGLPTEHSTPAPAAYRPPASPLPTTAASQSPNLGSILSQLANAIPKAPAPSPSTPTPAPTTTPAPSASGTTTSGIPAHPGVGGSTAGYVPTSNVYNVQYRAGGGPVAAGQPYVVGENQPELFVPHTSGTIVPQVPNGFGAGAGNLLGGLAGRFPLGPGPRFGGGGGMHPGPVPGPVGGPTPAPTPSPTTAPAGNPNGAAAGSALQNFANSAGEQFVLNQGQQALSGVNAANGVFDSGATGKALVQYGQGLGSTYLNDYLNNLNNYAKLGLSAAGAMTGAGGVDNSQSTGGSTSQSGSVGTSVGQSSGSSTGIGTSSGTSSGSGNSKNGLLPALGSVGF